MTPHELQQHLAASPLWVKGGRVCVADDPPGSSKNYRVASTRRFDDDDEMVDELVVELVVADAEGITFGKFLSDIDFQRATRADAYLPGSLGTDISTLKPLSAWITLVHPFGDDKDFEVASAGFTIANESSWTPFQPPLNQLFSITFSSLTIEVVRPFDRDFRELNATIEGKMRLLGVELSVLVQAPSCFITARQIGSTEINLRKYLHDEFDMSLPLKALRDFSRFTIRNIAVFVQPAFYYSFSMDVEPGTDLLIAGKLFPSFFLAVSCTTVGGLTSPGWRFETSTKPGEGIPLFTLINDLANQVDIAKELVLPAAVEHLLTIESIAVSYNFQSRVFGFECWGKFKFNKTVLDCCFTIEHDPDGETAFGGQILFGPRDEPHLALSLVFSTSADVADDSVMVLSARIPNGLKLDEVVEYLAGRPGDIPEALNPALTSLDGYLNVKTWDLVLAAETKSETKIVVAVSHSGENKKYAFLIDKNLHLGLSSLPLVGDRVAAASGKMLGIEDAGIEGLQAVITHGLADDQTRPTNHGKDDVGELNTLIGLAEQRFIGKVLPRLPKTPPTISQSSGLKIHLRVTYFFTDKPQEPVPFPFEDAPRQSGPSDEEEPVRAESQAAWLDVQRSFGPVSIKRLGIACEQGKVRFLLDASLVVSGLTMGLQGLSLAFPIATLIKFDRNNFLESLGRNLEQMSTKLDGLSVTYESGPIAISGGLLKVDPAPVANPASASALREGVKYTYNGQLLMKADTWALSVFGSFAQLESGDSSLFAYGVLNATLGGPSFFFVIGIAAGFGYNRNLTLPTLDALPAFPLIAAVDKPRSGGTSAPSEERLATLTRDIDRYVYPASGQNWLAVGVRFTSFKVIESFALMSFSFGNRFEIALLGLSKITMPFGAKKPILYAQLALEVKFAPEDGVLKIAAQLTPGSFILDDRCKLSGGFALYTWFKPSVKDGVDAGDFVLSIGGYHPSFKPPAGYPVVPRVAANWRVNNELTIKGGFYFALTPNAIMAGGALQANYESGRFKAWFDARVDFLILWEPFYYEAHAKLSLGVSYTIDNWLIHKTITCQVGVDLTLQGPPFGGKAVVDLYVCSFTLDFGTPDSAPQPLLWDKFKENFLPPVVSAVYAHRPGPAGATPTDSYCYSRATNGLIKELPSTSPVDWIVNPETFVIETFSAVPCSKASLVTESGAQDLRCDNVNFGVKPCDIQNRTLTSIHSIEWKKEKKDGSLVDWETPDATKSRLPRAAWYLDRPLPGPHRSQTESLELLKEPRTTDELTTGFKLAPKPRPKPQGTRQILVKVLESRAVPHSTDGWTKPTIPPGPLDQTEANPLSTVNEPRIKSRRDHIASVLKRQNIAVTADTTPTYLQSVRDDGLLAKPVLCELGR